MNFVDAVKAGYRNYVKFSDRSSRSEYWWWALYQFAVSIVIGLIFGGGAAQTGPEGVSFVYQGGIVANIWAIAHLLPNIAVGVRRLHDIGRSGWWLLIGLVPLVGLIVLIVWFCKKGDEAPNNFGSNPLGPQNVF